jgi:hypothetical protein
MAVSKVFLKEKSTFSTGFLVAAFMTAELRSSACHKAAPGSLPASQY